MGQDSRPSAGIMNNSCVSLWLCFTMPIQEETIMKTTLLAIRRSHNNPLHIRDGLSVVHTEDYWHLSLHFLIQ